MIEDDVVGVVIQIARALERAGLEYVIGGSVASSIYGEPRATRDIDVAVILTEATLPRLLTELGADFAADAEILKEAIRGQRSANIFYLPAFMKVDLFVRGNDPYDRVEFARKTKIEPSPGEAICASSPEDNLLWKLRWFEKGGGVSDQQWRDILGVLRIVGPKLDGEYLRRWASHFGVGELLVRALSQAQA